MESESPIKEININHNIDNENNTVQNNNEEKEFNPKIEKRNSSRNNSRKSSKKSTYKAMLREQKLGNMRSSQSLKNEAIDHYQPESCKDKIQSFVTSTPFSIVMAIITLYALFADDIRVAATTKDADPYFWGASAFCLAAFSLEIILQSISTPGYFLGFFFWLDFLSTVSLILDIGWISNLIFQTGKGKGGSVASLAKASRASRVGTRAGRIVRVVRLIRLVRLYKHAQQALQKQAKKFEEEQRQLMEEQKRMQQDQKSESFDSINDPQYQRNGTGNFKKGNSIRSKTPQITMLQQNGFTAAMNPALNGTQENGQDQQNDQMRTSQNKGEKGKMQTFLQRQGLDDQTNEIIPLNKNRVTPYDVNSKAKSNHSENNLVKSDMLEDQPQERNQKRHLSSNRDRNSSYSKSQSLNQSSNNNVSQSSATKASKLANQETKVGKALSDVTIKRVIVIVLCIMFSIPIFTYDTYTDPATSYQGGLSLIYQNKPSPIVYQNSISLYTSFNYNQFTPMIRLDIDGIKIFPGINDTDVPDFTTLRDADLTYYTYSDANGNIVATSIVSSQKSNQIDAGLSICRTVFVAVVLTIASIKFTGDVEKFILDPIENMLQKVKRISQNPLEAAQMEEKEQFAIEQLEQDGNVEELKRIKETEGYETTVLEKLIIRIGALLAVGFGEAGSEIIAKNMNNNGTVDPMLPGLKIMAVFGFCDIRNFTDATEVLQQGVMLFVNEIAQIVHQTVDQNLGSANKNIGDAFLLVWKFREQDYLKNADGTMEFLKNDITSNYADSSVIAFVKIMAAITLSKKLRKYKHHPGLQKRLKGYKVKMGFGLHFGWAIEGAIGSDYKIDASYLSPNVNIASRLEAATKQFGTGLLISGNLRDILSEKLQKQLRKIDCVTVKGSIVPLELYTCDVNLDRLYEKRKGKDPFDFSYFTPSMLRKKKVIDKMKRNALKSQILKGTQKPSDLFDKDHDIIEMRKEYTQEFYQAWEEAYKCYHDGKWVEAASLLKKTLVWFQFRQDGPSQTLYEHIKESTFIAPKDWKGFRILTEK
ncbi:cation channel family protein (macronuclear) [Tetrahymena thermophila SB210]|uniref:Cation channel family protein n=1 Tax=Tetrahymena thermophila (strain SB210) TaxID=312017 RepID=I7LVD2_TETTS|nr:cation channel family protein [Tetrahymena thermophila SB210]EAR97903.2 cation channel family protein [Tetrahymena thermophila SB210]|eukprot:XP_001018148.2 cation channel family protein [Tetrahymena thermophila SB210]